MTFKKGDDELLKVRTKKRQVAEAIRCWPMTFSRAVTKYKGVYE